MLAQQTAPIGVLFLAHGAPTNTDDIPAYLNKIRAPRPTPQALIDNTIDKYNKIGGASPLLCHTMDQVDAVAKRLGDQFRCYLGMRYWTPWIDDAIKQMHEEGITRAVSIVLAPQYSELSVAKYHKLVDLALEKYSANIEFSQITQYYDHPTLIQALAQRLQDALNTYWRPAEHAKVHIIFSAHSLPKRATEGNNTYVEQTQGTACLVAKAAGLTDERWSFSFAHAGYGTLEWLGPDYSELLPQLAARGIKDVVTQSVGFVSDHGETLYDIDIEAQAIADELGVKFHRAAALNADPTYILALLELIADHAKRWL